MRVARPLKIKKMTPINLDLDNIRIVKPTPIKERSSKACDFDNHNLKAPLK